MVWRKKAGRRQWMGDIVGERVVWRAVRLRVPRSGLSTRVPRAMWIRWSAGFKLLSQSFTGGGKRGRCSKIDLKSSHPVLQSLQFLQVYHILPISSERYWLASYICLTEPSLIEISRVIGHSVGSRRHLSAATHLRPLLSPSGHRRCERSFWHLSTSSFTEGKKTYLYYSIQNSSLIVY